MADPGGFHWFPRKPPFKSEDYFNTYIYAAIKNIYLEHTLYCYTTIPNQLSALLTTEYEQLSL